MKHRIDRLNGPACVPPPLSALPQTGSLFASLASYLWGDAMKRAATFAGALFLVFGIVSYSTPSNALGTAEERAACTPDVFRLCSGEIPNVSKIIACMKAKKSQLSPACQAAFNPSENTKEAAKATRSVGPVASDWCNFKGVANDLSQQNWITWCGRSAKLK